MRKIIVGEFVSLDGVIEGPGPGDPFVHAGWTMPYFNDEIWKITTDTSNADALLLGRVTYQTFAAAFASQTGGSADVMNNQTKYVVSTTLKKAEWQNSKLITGNISDEIAKIKQQPGKNIVVSGSGTLVQTLIKYDLVDEYSLLVYPLVLGTGKRLFGEGTAKIILKLVETRPLSTGVVLMRYEPERKS
jgi:dihydrofolate reductase